MSENKRVALALVCLLLALPVQARVERLDDSTSPRTRPTPVIVVSGDGTPLETAINVSETLMRYGRVDYRLSMAAYVGQQASIYLVASPAMPGLLNPGGVSMEWRGNGIFNNGVAHPGDRILVWQGKVSDSWMQEGLDIDIRVSRNALRLPQGVMFSWDSYFEIEVLP